MSKNITLRDLTDEQEQVIGLVLSLIGVADAPAKAGTAVEVEAEECSATRKDGKACQGTPLKGRDVCVAHSRGTAKAQPKAQPKAKAAQPKAKALIKDNRRAFTKAFVKEFGDVENEHGTSILHWSTKAIAEYVVTTEGVTAPKGYRIGDRYTAMFS